tara:strand:+ start:42 stop:281 length:240 start_codon:yes stop_codon:yes gene_type:complete
MSKSKSNTKNLKNKCNICDSEIEEDNGDIVGQFGICPVAFCVWCMSSITDMVIQLNNFDDVETLKERINDLNEEQTYRF